jgi:hypothetical protein
MKQLRGSVFSLTLMSKGEKRTWVALLPSMPKGEIVGMFYRQRMLVIDGKYNNDDQQRSDNRGGAATVIVGSTIQNSRWLSDLNVDKKSAQIWRIDLGC